MISEKLEKARAYEAENEKKITPQMRPVFHLTPRVGWMNDPNGFSYYNGAYHMFYQYYPYRPFWGPMHWGHAVSKDLLHWNYLPAALAPDEPYENGGGCFSGSAIDLADGRQLLVYTGVLSEKQPDGTMHDVQQQCVAVGDGVNYEKCENNPVMTAKQLPSDSNRFDFRDPKVWKAADGSYRCVMVNCDNKGDGRAVLFESKDGFSWNFKSILAQNNGKFGKMWECPDLFELDGKAVLIVSPMEMEAEGLEYPNGHGVVCQIGTYDDETGTFTCEHAQTVDYGVDFYAPQSTQTPDGRRVMIGWMQNWAFVNQHAETEPWFGQMALPRELSIVDGKLIQRPTKEFDACRKNPVSHNGVCVAGLEAVKLEGIEGRVADVELTIAPKSKDDSYYMFEMRFAQDDKHYTALRYRTHESELELDRSYSDSRIAMIHKRSCKAKDNGGKLKLRVVIDRFSAEVFANDGEQVMSVTFTTDTAAKEISFVADGTVYMDIVKYDIE